MKELFILYDWRDRKVLCSSYSKQEVYAYLGEMAEQGNYDGDIHVIKVELE